MVRRLVRGVVAPLMLVAVLTVASACGPARPAATPSPLPASASALAARLTQVVATGDRAGFDALFPASDDTPAPAAASPAASGIAASAGRRDLLWTNLRALASVTFEAGPDAGTLRVAWTVGPPDVAPAWQLVDGVVCGTGGCGLRNLAGMAGEPAPLWVLQPIVVTTSPTSATRPDVAVIWDGTGPDVWLAAAQAGVQAVQAADLSGLDDPSGAPAGLVVEVPESYTAFQGQLGQNGADFVWTGALTWTLDSGLPPAAVSGTPDRSDGASWHTPAAAVRVVVNPSGTTSLTASQRAALLAHEAVHVATAGHPAASGRTWVAEGLAELVGLTQDAQLASQSQAQARAACGPGGLTPPSDASFAGGDAERQDASYAVSWQLLTLLRAHEPAAQAQRDIVALWDASDASAAVLTDLAAWSSAWCAAR